MGEKMKRLKRAVKIRLRGSSELQDLKFERCVRKLKRRRGLNPYAVCAASVGRGKLKR